MSAAYRDAGVDTEAAAKAPKDGYTLLYTYTAAHVVNPSLYPKLSYDVWTDFEPVVLTSVVPLVLSVRPTLPVHTVQEFVAYVRSRPDKLSFGSAGIGNVTHLSGMHIRKSARSIGLEPTTLSSAS